MFLRMQAASAWLAMPIRISVCLISLRSCVRADLVRVWLNVYEYPSGKGARGGVQVRGHEMS